MLQRRCLLVAFCGDFTKMKLRQATLPSLVSFLLATPKIHSRYNALSNGVQKIAKFREFYANLPKIHAQGVF